MHHPWNNKLPSLRNRVLSIQILEFQSCLPSRNDRYFSFLDLSLHFFFSIVLLHMYVSMNKMLFGFVDFLVLCKLYYFVYCIFVPLWLFFFTLNILWDSSLLMLVAAVHSFFFFFTTIVKYIYGYITIYLSILLSMDVWNISSFLFPLANVTNMNIHTPALVFHRENIYE